MKRLVDANKLLNYKTDHEMISTHIIYNAPTVLTIPEQPTNGQMLLVLYPELEVRDFGSFIEAHSPNVEMKVSKSWWNAPYKGAEHGRENSV